MLEFVFHNRVVNRCLIRNSFIIILKRGLFFLWFLFSFFPHISCIVCIGFCIQIEFLLTENRTQTPTEAKKARKKKKSIPGGDTTLPNHSYHTLLNYTLILFSYNLSNFLRFLLFINIQKIFSLLYFSFYLVCISCSFIYKCLYIFFLIIYNFCILYIYIYFYSFPAVFRAFSLGLVKLKTNLFCLFVCALN